MALDPGEAILRVLRRARKPLTTREITSRMTQEEFMALYPPHVWREPLSPAARRIKEYVERRPAPPPFPPDGVTLWADYPYAWRTASLRVAARLKHMVRSEYVKMTVIVEESPTGALSLVRRYTVA